MTLTLSQTAKYINVTRQTLYKMIEDGRFKVKPIKGTKPRRWNLDAVDAWRAGQK